MTNDRPQTTASRWDKLTRRHWALLWLGLAVVLYTPFIDTGPGQGNVASDLAAIESLVQRHTFFINGSTFFGTIDKFKRGDHYFSQKSPVFHLLAAGPYWAMTRLGWTLRDHTAACLRGLTLLLVILPMGWLLGLIFDHPWMRTRPLRVRATLTLLFAAGSLLTPFAVTFNHYILAAACLMAAVNTITARGLATRRAALAAGWWVSASLACDVPPAFLFGAGLGLAALARAPRRLFWIALGAAPLLLLYAALNQRILGSPLPPNLHEAQYQYFEGSYWAQIKAQAEAGHPGYYQASYGRRLWHATLGHKGIYWMMPLAALATAAALALARRRAPGWPLALAWAAFPPLAIALTMRWAWDLSGGAYNIRHVLATIPPLYCVLGHPALPRPGPVLRISLGVAYIWSVLIAALGVVNPWSHNTLSAVPPLENMARIAMAYHQWLPDEWVGELVRNTSVTPEVGWLDLGEAWLSQNRLRQAEWALREAIQAAPRQPLPYYHLGITLDRQGRTIEAIVTYQTLLSLEPENLGAWNNLAIFAMKSDNLALAREAYRHSAALAPGNLSWIWGQLKIGEIEGHPDVAGLRDALKKFPGDLRFKRLAEAWGLKP